MNGNKILVSLTWMLAWGLVVLLSPANGFAVGAEKASPGEKQDGDWQQVLEFIRGKPAANALYLGMWSYHFIDNDDVYRTTHDLLGLTYKGVFGGTFKTRAMSVAGGLVFSATFTAQRSNS